MMLHKMNNSDIKLLLLNLNKFYHNHNQKFDNIPFLFL